MTNLFKTDIPAALCIAFMFIFLLFVISAFLTIAVAMPKWLVILSYFVAITTGASVLYLGIVLSRDEKDEDYDGFN